MSKFVELKKDEVVRNTHFIKDPYTKEFISFDGITGMKYYMYNIKVFKKVRNSKKGKHREIITLKAA